MQELLVITPLIYAGAAYGLFHWLDENASDEAKTVLARTMTFKDKDYKSKQVASALVEVFDRIYTYPLLRWRAFFRSFLFTTVVSAIYVFEAPSALAWMVRGSWARELEFLLYALLFNVFIDYLSLFVIRPVLVRSGTKPVIGLALGAVSAVGIALAGNYLRGLVLLAGFIIIDAGENWLTMLRATLVASAHPFDLPMTSLLYFLTFAWPAMAVFVWLPLFALGILIARLLTPWMVEKTQWFLKEGKEHPLKAIGYVAAIVVFLGTVAARAVFSA